MHVHKGSAGSVDSATNAVITLENSTHGILQFLTPNNVSNQIRFGDVNDNGRGYIDYNHSTDNLSIAVGGSEAARFDASGNLGIGTSAPHDSGANFSMLTLNGPKGGGIVFSDDDVNQHQIYTTDDASLRFARGSGLSDESMRIDSSGRLGLKTTAMSSFNQISGADLFVMGSGAGNQGMTIYSGSTGTGTIAFADGTTTSQQYEGIIQYDHSANSMTFYSNHAERMRIDSSGNVGIGVTPTEILHLKDQTAIIKLECSDASLTGDQVLGGIQWRSNDPSGIGVNDVGQIMLRSASSVGSYYMQFNVSSSSSANFEAMRIEQQW